MSEEKYEPFPYEKYWDFPEEYNSGEESVPSYGFDSGKHSFTFSVDTHGIYVQRWFGGGSPYEAYNYSGFWPDDVVWSVCRPRLADLIFNEVPNSPIQDAENFKTGLGWSCGDALNEFLEEEQRTSDEELPKLREKWPEIFKRDLRFGPVTCEHDDITEPDYAAVSINYGTYEPDYDDWDDEDDSDEIKRPSKIDGWILNIWYSDTMEEDWQSESIRATSFEHLLEIKHEIMLDWSEKEIRKRLIAHDPAWRKFLRRRPKKKG